MLIVVSENAKDVIVPHPGKFNENYAASITALEVPDPELAVLGNE